MTYIILFCLFIFSFWTSHVYSLDQIESLNNVKILRVFNPNIIVLNRGIEDGILKDDHAKLTHQEMGFVARLICLKSSLENSTWKAYRVTDDQKFSKDFNYQIVGLATSEIPPHLKKLRFHPEKVFLAERKEKKSPQVIRDLPQELEKNDFPLQQTTNVFNKEQFKRELRHHQISLFVSPYIKQSINSSQNLRYGFSTKNNARTYLIESSFEQHLMKQKDTVSGRSILSRSSFGTVSFRVKNMTKNTSTLSLINYRSQYFSSFGTPAQEWLIGFIGLNFHLMEKEGEHKLELSYVPLLDLRVNEAQSFTDASLIKKSQTSGLRHGLGLKFVKKISERVHLDNLLWYRPAQNLSEGKISFEDMNLKNDLKVSLAAGGNLFLDYHLIYQKDELWARLNSFSPENIIYSFNIRFNFNL